MNSDGTPAEKGEEKPQPKPLAQTANPDEAADRIIYDYLNREGVRLKYQEGDRAFYSVSNLSVSSMSFSISGRILSLYFDKSAP